MRNPDIYSRENALERHMALYQTNYENDETEPIFELEKSPFHRKRNLTTKRGSLNVQTQISKDVEEDFMRFAIMYNEAHGIDNVRSKSQALQHIILDFLNNNALYKESFENLHVILAFNNPFETDMQIKHIGVIEQEGEFVKNFKHGYYFKDNYNFIYCLKKFDKKTFDSLELKTVKKSVFFNVDRAIQHDFEKVKTRLNDTYREIDFDNAYFVVININNYLDINNDGVFVSKHSQYKHEGLIVLLNPETMNLHERICICITWSYNAGKFNFDLNVVEIIDFVDIINQTEMDLLIEEYWSISTRLMTGQGRLLTDLDKHKRDLMSIVKHLKQTYERLDKSDMVNQEGYDENDEFKDFIINVYDDLNNMEGKRMLLNELRQDKY